MTAICNLPLRRGIYHNPDSKMAHRKSLIFWIVFIISLLGYGDFADDKSDTKKIDKKGPRNDSVLYQQFLEEQAKYFNSSMHDTSAATGCKFRDRLSRMNGSRFFVFDFIYRKDVETNITVARKFCEELSENGTMGKWRLARIEKMTTFRMIAQYFESKTMEVANDPRAEGAKDTWYWIDAHFNYTTNVFENSDGQTLKFNNVLLYRHFRPMGIGAHEIFDAELFNFKGAKTKNFQQCLTFSLPWPVGNQTNYAKYNNKTFGFQASFDERACEATQKLSPMCENLEPECNAAENFEKNRNFNYFNIEGYAQQSYIDDGVWVFANRRFLVNYVPRNKEESKLYCESLKTKLYTPHGGDSCLIPYLKLWNLRLTHLHFWTSIKAEYTGDGKTSRMRYENNTQFAFQLGKYLGPYVLNVTAQGRTDASDPWIKAALERLIQNQTLHSKYTNLCVTANWAYEYPNETTTNTKDWNFLAFAFANCKLYMGTICEPLDVEHEGKHKCNWQRGWTANYELAINFTAVIKFGSDEDAAEIYRSTYKQQFGQHICQTPENVGRVDYEISFDTFDYHLITVNQLETGDYHYYDYLEPYWVIDHRVPEEDWFKNATIDTEGCLVSVATRIPNAVGDQIAFKREVKVVNCLEWHFYLCGPDQFDSWVHEEL